jgi:hypothetical protein
MRHTLLPLHERKALRREYRVRFIIVACFLGSLAGLIGVGALFPAYMRALAEEKSQIEAAANLKHSQDVKGITARETELHADSKIINTLSSNVSIRMSSVAESIIILRQAVKLKTFIFNQTSTTTVSISISGIAPTRNDLLSFKARLENTLPGARVELPISELSKSTNVDFDMKLTYKLP